MNARTLYFDESGYTGYNLLDDSQPIFAIASTDIDPGQAETIPRESFPDYQGDEFEFTNIWRGKHRARLPEFGAQRSDILIRARPEPVCRSAEPVAVEIAIGILDQDFSSGTRAMTLLSVHPLAH